MNNVASITKFITLQSVGACCECGIQFAFDSEIVARRKQDGKNFTCPNGHSQAYVDSEVSRLKKQLESKDRQLANEREWGESYRKRNRELDKSNSALRGVVTRTKNRIKNGVCPCCKRSFQNVHEHMKTKHPEYGGEK